MSEFLDVPNHFSKSEKYSRLYHELSIMLADESDETLRAVTILSGLKDVFQFLWVGIYRVVGSELLVGPYQGPLACFRISLGKGVCGSSWQQQKSLLVPDVSKFPGHIACSARSQSEIVVPLWQGSQIKGVLDVDSEILGGLDTTDLTGLERLATLFFAP
jgi:L-methionine (R)-S-oxide reductase